MTAVAAHERATATTLARQLLPAELHRWIDRLGPDLGRICAHQIGADCGKLIRPALAFGCAQAAGGSPQDALPAAVAVELIHNASLVHDDIMDGDEYRRHRPTVWKQYGVAQAILAGDALIGLAFEALTTDAPPEHAGVAAADLARAVRSLAIGQHVDLQLEGTTTATTAQCLALIAGKTGALLAVACRLGARLGGAPPAWLDAFGEYGNNLGIAFQLVDDLLGIWGDPAVTGKPVGSALSTSVSAASRLRELYGSTEPMSDRDVAQARELVEGAGGRAWAVEQCGRHVASATAALDQLPIDAAACDALHELTDRVVARVP